MTRRTLSGYRHEVQLYPSKFNAWIVAAEIAALVVLVALVCGSVS